MLTPEQVSALRDAAGQVADPISEYLIGDIARRVSEAGQLTSTAAYQVWRAQQLGVSQREIRKRLQKLLGVSQKEIKRLLTQSAEVGYNFDLKNLPHGQAVPFTQNEAAQQIVSAAVRLAQNNFMNLTQTLGMTDPFGNALPLRDAYRKSMDYAFEQVFTGAADYQTAIRQATKNLADKGIRIIDYESGVHTSMEAAVRRNVMGGLGLMQEQISQQNHDELGADGWEISAHAASAPDHEPIQGLQYSDVDYKALNDSLVRRIGTLNCGHTATPIILGVSKPQYTLEELERFRTNNAAGITYQGRRYTMYEATQKQRDVETAIRTQKRRILTDESTEDKDKLLTDQIRLARLNDEYQRFSKAAGLRTQPERAEVAGFRRSEAAKANWNTRKAAAGIANTGKNGIISIRGSYVPAGSNFQPLDAAGYRALRKAAGKISSADLKTIWDHTNGYIQTGNSWSINEAMRNGTVEKLSPASQNTIRVLQSVIDRNATDRDFMAVRYADNNYLQAVFGQNIFGSTIAETAENIRAGHLGRKFMENAFVSVSLDEKKNVFQNKPVRLKIEIPDGTNIYASGNYQESEAIMRDGARYVLRDAREVNDQLELTVRVT